MFIERIVSFQEYIEISITVGMIGLLGILSNKKNLLISLLSIEMMFYGLNLALLIISLYPSSVNIILIIKIPFRSNSEYKLVINPNDFK